MPARGPGAGSFRLPRWPGQVTCAWPDGGSLACGSTWGNQRREDSPSTAGTMVTASVAQCGPLCKEHSCPLLSSQPQAQRFCFPGLRGAVALALLHSCWLQCTGAPLVLSLPCLSHEETGAQAAPEVRPGVPSLVAGAAVGIAGPDVVTCECHSGAQTRLSGASLLRALSCS